MRSEPHPRTVTRRQAPARVVALVYTPAPERKRWVEAELSRGDALAHRADDIGTVVTMLVEAPAPRPQVLVIDLDAVPAGELFHLHSIRERGWTGTIVALGNVPIALRSSLKIARVIPPPFVENALCDEVVNYRIAFESKTAQIPTLLEAFR